jgi:hypothetical protein
MNELGLLELFAYLRMALVTDLFTLGSEQLFRRRPMGVMTRGTPALKGRVCELFLHLSLHVNMAGKAQFRPFFEDQSLVFRFMGVVARGAITGRCRAVNKFEFHLVWVAREAEIFEWLLEQFRLP